MVLDRERMRELPPGTPEPVFRIAMRMPQDYYLRVFSNDDSLDASFIGRIVDVVADLDTVWVTHVGVIIATLVRYGPRELVVTDHVNAARAALARHNVRTQNFHGPEPGEAVQVRVLDAFYEIFGVDLGKQPNLVLEVAS